jgi:hypothetical protein
MLSESVSDHFLGSFFFFLVDSGFSSERLRSLELSRWSFLNLIHKLRDDAVTTHI